MNNGSPLSKIVENSVCDISSCRNTQTPYFEGPYSSVDLNALYQHPVPPDISSSGFAASARGRQRFFFDPKHLGTPWKFHKKFFTAVYLSPTCTNSPFLQYQFYFRFGARSPPSPEKFVLFCFIGCEIANLARD